MDRYKAVCTLCNRAFNYVPDQVPVQRGVPERKRVTGDIVAYYPTCPYCRNKVEVCYPKGRSPKE